MNAIEDAKLLQQNRADIVATLNSLGFSEVDADTPLSEIAEYMKWAGGLRDIRLACFHKTTKEQAFFTREEWSALSASNKSTYIRMGVVIRANCHEFIISKDNATTVNGSQTMPWAPNNSNNVKGLADYYGNPNLLEDWDSEGNTDLILAAVDTNGIDYPAAQRARAYKCSTVADGGVDDPTTWNLPAIGPLYIMLRYFNEINAELTYFFGSANVLTNDWYWSSTECDSSGAWHVNFNYGYMGSYSKAHAGRVRPVAPVAVRTSASAI